MKPTFLHDQDSKPSMTRLLALVAMIAVLFVVVWAEVKDIDIQPNTVSLCERYWSRPRSRSWVSTLLVTDSWRRNMELRRLDWSIRLNQKRPRKPIRT